MRNKVKLKPRFKIYSLVAAFKTLFQAHFTKTSTNHSKILRYGYHICLFSAHFSRQVASLVPSSPGMKKANESLRFYRAHRTGLSYLGGTPLKWRDILLVHAKESDS